MVSPADSFQWCLSGVERLTRVALDMPFHGIPSDGILRAVSNRTVPADQLPLTVPVFQILLSLADQDLHGYALIHDIEARTSGEVRLTASTLYGAIARMLDAGLVEELESAETTRRRCYRITRTGRVLARREAERMARATRWARQKRLLPGAADRTP